MFIKQNTHVRKKILLFIGCILLFLTFNRDYAYASQKQVAVPQNTSAAEAQKKGQGQNNSSASTDSSTSYHGRIQTSYVNLLGNTMVTIIDKIRLWVASMGALALAAVLGHWIKNPDPERTKLYILATKTIVACILIALLFPAIWTTILWIRAKL